VKEILRQVVIPGSEAPLPHVNPSLKIDVLVTHRDDEDERLPWREYGRVQHSNSNFCDLRRKHAFRVFAHSVIIVRQKGSAKNPQYRLVSMFLTCKTDAALYERLRERDPPKVADVVKKNIVMRDPGRWSSQSQGKSLDIAGNIGYKGEIYNEGVQYNKYGQSDVYGYHARRKDVPEVSDEYLATVARYVFTLSGLEKRYMPGVFWQRRDSARKFGTLSILPNIPTEYVPANLLGVSRGFTNNIHADRTAKGVLESIAYWRGKSPQPVNKERGGGWGFATWQPRTIYDLNAWPASFVYVPGNEIHGTIATGPGNSLQEHTGIGTALFNRATILNDKWRRLLATYGNDRAALARALAAPVAEQKGTHKTHKTRKTQ